MAGGLIAEVGTDLTADGLPVYDGGGATVLPGLIDTHVHASNQGRIDALRFGTTTVLDMHTTRRSGLADAAEARESVEPTRWADQWSAGLGVTAPGGWPDDGRMPTLDTDTDPAEFVADRLAEGSDYIKVFLEDGSRFPDLSYHPLTTAQVRAVIAAAHDEGVLAVAHVAQAADAVTVVEAGTDALVHVPSADRFTPDQLDTMRSAGAPVVATLSVQSAISCGSVAETLQEDPRIEPLLSHEQRRSFRASWTCDPSALDNAMANIRDLHDAGVPILAGTDTPNPGTAFGISMFGELRLLVESGLSPSEALSAATAAPAEVFGLADRGRLAAGMCADLVLVTGDPTADVDAVVDIVAVWKNGQPVDRDPR